MELTYIVDAVLLLIFLFVVLHAARVGLTKSLAGIVAWIAASVIALQCCAPLAERVYVTFFQERVIASVQNNIQQAGAVEELVGTVQKTLDGLPQFVVRAAQSVGIDTEALVQKTQSIDTAASGVAQSIEQAVLAPTCTAALKVVLLVLMLVGIAVLGRLILNPLAAVIGKIPVIGHADRALGGVLGLLKGAVLVAVLAILAKLAASFTGGVFAEAVAQSKLISLITESPFSSGFFE